MSANVTWTKTEHYLQLEVSDSDWCNGFVQLPPEIIIEYNEPDKYNANGDYMVLLSNNSWLHIGTAAEALAHFLRDGFKGKAEWFDGFIIENN